MIKYKLGNIIDELLKIDIKQNVLFPHVCNNLGGFKKGLVLSISKQWKEPEEIYRNCFKTKGLQLGQVQGVKVQPNIYILNMIAQDGYKNENNKVALRYDALETCMKKISDSFKNKDYEIHTVRFGCGLAGGSWDKVEPLIQKYWGKSFDIYVYDYL